MNRGKQLGFGLGLHSTLSDLLPVLAILVILTVVAVPQYLDFRTQKRVREAIASLEPARAAVRKAFETKGPGDMALSLPAGWAPADMAHVQSVAIGHNGSITIQFAESIAPRGQNVLQLVPVRDGKPVDLSRPAAAGWRFEWRCGAPAGDPALPEKYRPVDCR